MKQALFAATLLAFCACNRGADVAVVHAQDAASGDGASEETAQPGVVRLDAGALARLAIEVRELQPSREQSTLVAPGVVAGDPARTFDLRPPFSGTLRAGAHVWPELGATLADGAQVAALEARLSAAERIDLASRLEALRGDERAAGTALEALRTALARAQSLNAQDKNVSDRAVQEADAAVRAQSAALDSARAAQRVLEAALDGSSSALAALPLTVAQGGEVVAVGARVGETVEAGALLLQVARFDEVLVRVRLPLELDADVRAVDIEPWLRRGTLIGAALVGRVGGNEQDGVNPVLVVRVASGACALRPGEAVTAYLRLEGAEREGVLITRESVVRFESKAWVYTQTDVGEFTRREVLLDAPRAEGWFVVGEWTRGARVVTVGAQSLLSTEVLGAGGGAAEEEE